MPQGDSGNWGIFEVGFAFTFSRVPFSVVQDVSNCAGMPPFPRSFFSLILGCIFIFYEVSHTESCISENPRPSGGKDTMKAVVF